MYYIKNGLGNNYKWLAVVFCIFGATAAFTLVFIVIEYLAVIALFLLLLVVAAAAKAIGPVAGYSTNLITGGAVLGLAVRHLSRRDGSLPHLRRLLRHPELSLRGAGRGSSELRHQRADAVEKPKLGRIGA